MVLRSETVVNSDSAHPYFTDLDIFEHLSCSLFVKVLDSCLVDPVEEFKDTDDAQPS